MGYFKKFFLELKAWHIVRREYKKNKYMFDAIGLKSNWFGKLYKVINRLVKSITRTKNVKVYIIINNLFCL